MEKGIYINSNNFVVYAGNKKRNDPDGLTWHSLLDEEMPTEKLIINNIEVYEWNGSSVVKRSEAIAIENNITIDKERDESLRSGFEYLSFPGDITGNIQTRNLKDEINILTVVLKAVLLKLADDTTTTIKFRDKENVIHEMNSEAIINMANSIFPWAQSIYENSWNQKDS